MTDAAEARRLHLIHCAGCSDCRRWRPALIVPCPHCHREAYDLVGRNAAGVSVHVLCGKPVGEVAA